MDTNSRARRKTFTLKTGTVSNPSVNPCNRTFVAEKATSVASSPELQIVPDSGEGSPNYDIDSVATEVLATPSVFKVPMPPRHDKHKVFEKVNNSDQQKQGEPDENLVKFDLGSFKEYTSNINETISLNVEALNCELYGEDVSLFDKTTSSNGDGADIFETSIRSVASSKASKKLIAENLEQLIIKEKLLIDELDRIRSANRLNEKENQAKLIQLKSDEASLFKETERLKRRKKEIAVKLDTAKTKREDTIVQNNVILSQTAILKDFVDKHIKLDGDMKCTDKRFCKEFHGSKCFSNPCNSSDNNINKA